MSRSDKSDLTALLHQFRKKTGIQPIPLSQQEEKLPLAALGAAFSNSSQKSAKKE
uniref:Uncharacterized protein n=1 Tax=Magnetococcus massalia (strain MO-1) TaxID=451514 RepID=A0A1S7LI22_MAGMO|nr:protein of unknown function [Candidatus Magnetococcus massalia]